MSNIGRKQSLSQAGHPVHLGQELSGQKLLVRGRTVFRRDIFAIGIRVPLPEGRDHLLPGAPEHALAQEILHHCPARAGSAPGQHQGCGAQGAHGGQAGAQRVAAMLAAIQSLQRRTQPLSLRGIVRITPKCVSL